MKYTYPTVHAEGTTVSSGNRSFVVPKYGTDLRRHVVSMAGDLGLLFVNIENTFYVTECTGPAQAAGIPAGSVITRIDEFAIGRDYIPRNVVEHKRAIGAQSVAVDVLYPTMYYYSDHDKSAMRKKSHHRKYSQAGSIKYL
ncbi:hypothetical protein DIPPA_24662 [Diplonema papillatum]|nr:hypothetical protein DIPPA_24662 [Diplonema papillatum]